MDAISPLPNSERVAAIATVTAAFAADPVERWLWPEADRYESCFPDFVAAFGGQAFEHDSAWGLDDASAVALWLAPGVKSDEEKVVGILSETVAQEKHDDLFSTLEQMAAAREPLEACAGDPSPDPSPLVPALARGRTRPPGPRPRRTAARAQPLHRRRRRTTGIPRDPEPPNRSALRKARLRGHRNPTSRKLPADDLNAPSRHGVDGLRMGTKFFSRQRTEVR